MTSRSSRKPWQGRAFALTLLSEPAGREGTWTRSGTRSSAWTEPPTWTTATTGAGSTAPELMLTDSALLAPSAIDARARNLRGEQVEEPPIPEPAKPDYTPIAEGSLRTVDAAPAFAVGRSGCGPRTCRRPDTPGCRATCAGTPDVVALIQPAAVLPDTNAHFQGENPQYVYSVRFDSARAVGRRRRTVRAHHRDVRELSGGRHDHQRIHRTHSPVAAHRGSRATADRAGPGRPERRWTRSSPPTRRNVGPLNGAKVVAKAWTDPEYRRWLLDDGTAAIKELGFLGLQTEHVVVVENTATSHNVVVCTLCSCYPWQLLGLPPSWYKDPAYRARVVKEPRKVLSEMGLELADDVQITVHDSSSEVRWLVLPERPAGTEGLSEEQLVPLVTRDAMVGVAKVEAP